MGRKKIIVDNNSEAYDVLLKDPVLKPLIEKAGKLPVPEKSDIYLSLLRAIVSQQLSTKAANTIWSRFLSLFPDDYPYPIALLSLSEDRLRVAGLSYNKAGYLKNIANYFNLNETELDVITNKSDTDLIELLTSIKGVGRWTAQMVLIFSLNREDVFPDADLGIRNAMVSLYGLTEKGKELSNMMILISDKWKPYRSIACRYLWTFRDIQ